MAEEIHGTIAHPGWDERTIAVRRALFDQYVAPYLNMIYKLCIQYTYNKANVEENYTEVLENFYRRVETYDPSRSILTWLHIVTKRQIADIEKRRTKLANNDDSVHIEDYSGCDCFDDTDGVSSNVLGVDNYRLYYNDEILQVLDNMKDIHRDALVMQEACYTFKEIAEEEFRKGRL